MGRILLAEDEELVGTMIRMNLECAGHGVRWVRDGRQALEACGRERFDLVLLDIGLPEKDGLQVLAGLRRGGDQLPVMMLTARGDVSSKVGAFRGGADDYLSKPFDVPELLARVEALLRRLPRKAGADPSDS